MKNKIGIILLSALLLTSCSVDNSTLDTETNAEIDLFTESTTEATTENVIKENKPLYENKDRIGNGYSYLINESGDTKSKTSLVVYVNEGFWMSGTICGVNFESYDGSLLTYIYLDGKLKSKEQVSDASISLDTDSDNGYALGNHYVETIQYKDNDESADIINYQCLKYEVVSK